MKLDAKQIFVLIAFLLLACFLWGRVAVLEEKVAWLESEVLELKEPHKKLYNDRILEE